MLSCQNVTWRTRFKAPTGLDKGRAVAKQIRSGDPGGRRGHVLPIDILRELQHTMSKMSPTSDVAQVVNNRPETVETRLQDLQDSNVDCPDNLKSELIDAFVVALVFICRLPVQAAGSSHLRDVLRVCDDFGSSNSNVSRTCQSVNMSFFVVAHIILCYVMPASPCNRFGTSVGSQASRSYFPAHLDRTNCYKSCLDRLLTLLD
jgi:hypothetical protein